MLGCSRCLHQQLTGTGQVISAAGVGDQSVVSDAMEPCGQDVKEKAPNELIWRSSVMVLYRVRPLAR